MENPRKEGISPPCTTRAIPRSCRCAPASAPVAWCCRRGARAACWTFSRSACRWWRASRGASARTPAVGAGGGVGCGWVGGAARGQGSMLDFRAQRLPMGAREQWRQRMHAGDVVDERGRCVAPEQPVEGGPRLYYYRSLSAEPVLPFAPTLLHQDPHLVGAV